MVLAALIVAAGSGERLGPGVPKAYRAVRGVSLLRRSLGLFLNHPSVDRVLVVAAPGHGALYAEATAGLDLPPPAEGGATRQASVLLGLEAMARWPAPPDRVLIHDAARPFATASLIERVIGALDRAEGALPAVPVVDSLRRVEAGALAGEVPRDGLVRAQTPQCFRFAPLLEAHRALAGVPFTDDAALARAHGLAVAVALGEEDNFKVTHPDDLERAEALALAREAGAASKPLQAAAPAPNWRYRTGQGFDVHAFADANADRPCLIGGVAVPHDRGLAGHSDADVALHALTDALLGVSAAGDIGSHFPPSDSRWKDADSVIFLNEALRILCDLGGELEHVDLTVICERPKIGPHREAIRARLGGLLGLPLGAVSVKATTTERLGFTGRGEGIAAQAVATARFPA